MMASEDDKPLHKQFLRVQREEEEDTWISGEELKTEGSSGSDDEVPRRKITSRKSRRRRSEGYTPPESRLSLPNLGDNKVGIAFKVSKPDEKGERFSTGGDLCAEEEKMRLEAAMTRMSTRSSLDKMDEANIFGSESDWRPKRGSLKLPNLEEVVQRKKVIRFSDKVETIENDCSEEEYNRKEDCFLEFTDSHDEEDYNIDRYVLNASNAENWRPILKNTLKLPKLDVANVDNTVEEFVSEMDDFYKRMTGKLKSLKNCPALRNSQTVSLDGGDQNFMQKDDFKNLYKNLKMTPQVKKTLNIINQMDCDISATIAKFWEERTDRMKIQNQFVSELPKDRNSELFLQLCEFEAKSNENTQNESKNRKQEVNESKRRAKKEVDEKNFIQRNIELAKIGMNCSLSDEQKERLEKILRDEAAVINDDEYPSIDKSGNHILACDEEEYNEQYSKCRMNAYKFRNDHKKRLEEINAALEAYKEDDSAKSSETNVLNSIRSLKEIDEKLRALSESQQKDGEFILNKRNNSAGSIMKDMRGNDSDI